MCLAIAIVTPHVSGRFTKCSVANYLLDCSFGIVVQSFTVSLLNNA